MGARLILLIHSIADWFAGLNDERHLTTDPACIEYRAPRPGSRLDRASRGVSCVPCMVTAAFGDEQCTVLRTKANLGVDCDCESGLDYDFAADSWVCRRCGRGEQRLADGSIAPIGPERP